MELKFIVTIEHIFYTTEFFSTTENSSLNVCFFIFLANAKITFRVGIKHFIEFMF